VAIGIWYAALQQVAGVNHLTHIPRMTAAISVKQVKVLSFCGMITNRGVAPYELHVTCLSLAIEAKGDAVFLGTIVIAVPGAARPCEEQDYWVAPRSADSTL
jgi:hypothetical protein